MTRSELSTPQKGSNTLLATGSPNKSRAASAVSFSDNVSIYPGRSDHILPKLKTPDSGDGPKCSSGSRYDSGDRRRSRTFKRERRSGNRSSGSRAEESAEDSEVQFSKLQKMFEAAEDDGRNGLDIDEFKAALRQTVGRNSTEDEIELLFMKVDANCDGVVDWEEYVTYNLLEYKEKTLMFEMLREKPFPNEIREIDSKHRDTIIRIRFYPNVRKTGGKDCTIDYKRGRYVTMSKEGVIGIWSLSMKNLKYYNANQYFDRNTQPWFTDMVIMYNVNMLAVASTDRDIAIFELSLKKFSMRYYMTGFENCVTAMDYWVNPKDLNYALLLWGDTSGSIFAIKFENSLRGGPFGAVSGRKKACKRVSFPEVLRGFVLGAKAMKFLNVHEDWVGKVQYLPDIDFFMSSCNSPNTALFFGDFQGKKTPVYFKVNKGVLSFDYSYYLNIIVTGGMDYMLRVWNPYVNNKAIVLLKGHTKPVNQVIINEKQNQVISIDKGRNLRVFDLRDQTCLQQISGRVIKFEPFSISAALYNPKMRTMLVAANQIVMLEKKEEDERYAEIVSHQRPIVGAIYNKVFGTCVSACQDSVVSVWDTNTGVKAMQFVNAHSRLERGVEIPVEITALCFDHNGRRLVTGARNGTVHIWNFNNGSCMQKFQLPDFSDVTGLVCTKHRVYVTGWGKTVYIYVDGGGEEHRKAWKKQHREDILCIAYLSPNIIATGSYDGDVIIWSRETGQVYCRLNAFVTVKPIGENSTHIPKGKSAQPDLGTPSHQTVGSEADEEEMQLQNNQWRRKYKMSTGFGLGILSKFRNSDTESIAASESESPEETVDHPLLKAFDISGSGDKDFYSKEAYDDVCKTYESSVEKMIFLQTRETLHKETAIIVTSGAEGWIRFWSMHHEGGLLGQFNSSHRLGESVLAMITDLNDRFLFTGDTQGYVKIWDIADYCISKKMKLTEKKNHFEQMKRKFTFFRVEAYEEEKYKETIPRHLRNIFSSRPPPSSSDPKRTLKYPVLLNSFRAHTRSIHSVDYVTDREILITASADCSVRLWTLNGQYIGTFGERWKPLPPVVTTDYFLSQMPSDIRRTGSARTLKVLNAGKTPMWYNAFKLIRFRGLERLKKQFEHLQTKDEEIQKEAEEKLEVSNILGKSYKRMTRHKMPPRLPKFIETPGSVSLLRRKK